MGWSLLLLLFLVLCGLAVAMRLVRCILLGIVLCMLGTALIQSFRTRWQYEPDPRMKPFISILQKGHFMISGAGDFAIGENACRIVEARFLKRGPDRSTSLYEFRLTPVPVAAPGRRLQAMPTFTEYFRVEDDPSYWPLEFSITSTQPSRGDLIAITVGRVISGWLFRALAVFGLAGLGFLEHLSIRSAVRARRRRLAARRERAAEATAQQRPAGLPQIPPPLSEARAPSPTIPGASPPARKALAGGAVRSVVWGLVSIPLCMLILGGVFAIVDAHKARKAIDADPASYRGEPLAWIGTILGVATILLGAIGLFGLAMAIGLSD